MSQAISKAVIEEVLLRQVEGMAGVVHVFWRAMTQGERVVQAYVDGRLAAVSAEAAERELWLMVDASKGHRVDLLAVPRDEAWRDFGSELEALGDTKLGWRLGVVRDLRLPMETVMQVKAGERVVHESMLFAGDQTRSGFGGLMGLGTFGFDDATAPGLGEVNSELGNGPLGFDGGVWHFVGVGEVANQGTVTLLALDATGAKVAQSWVMEDVVRRTAPRSAEDVRVETGTMLVWR